MIQPGQRIAVACSGGADSTTLLLILRALANRLGCMVSVTHLNHCLRAEQSDADEKFVQCLAERLGLSLQVERTDVRRRAKEAHSNLEETARRLRHEFFLRLIESGQADRVAVGHTADDQAETVLFRLLRGAGTRGLAAIYPMVAGKIIRPLLQVRRQAILKWLQERGQPWREDLSNQDLRYMRNRIRHQLLPSLVEFNPRIVETLTETAELARDEETFWQEYLQLSLGHILHMERGKVVVDVRSLRKMPTAAVRRVLRNAMGKAAELSLMEHPEALTREVTPVADFGQIQQLLVLALEGQSGATLSLPQKIKARKEFAHLILEKEEYPQSRGFCYQLQIPAVVEVPAISATFSLQFVSLAPGQTRYNKEGDLLDSKLVNTRLVLRNWQRGDAYQPRGYWKQRKLKELFQRDRIPLGEREGWPVIIAEDNNQVVWARRWGVAKDFSPDVQSRQAVLIQESRNEREE